MKTLRLISIFIIATFVFQGCRATTDKLLDKSDSMMINSMKNKIGESYSGYTQSAMGKISFGNPHITNVTSW